MLPNHSTVGMAAALALICVTAGQAGVATFATSSFGFNEYSGTGSTYSRSVAGTRRVSGIPIYSGGSFTAPPVCGGLCLDLVQDELGEVSIDATTGRGRAHAHAGFDGIHPGLEAGYAEAGFTLTDTLEIDFSTPFAVSLDLLLTSFRNLSGPSVNEYAAWSVIYQISLTHVSEDFEGLLAHIVLNGNSDSGVVDTIYRIATEDDEGLHIVEEGATIRDLYHFTGAMSGPGFPIVTSYNLELSMYVHATCQAEFSPGCSAIISSPNSSYVSFTGDFASQNNYGYAGLVGDVPEPVTVALCSVALALLALRRRR